MVKVALLRESCLEGAARAEVIYLLSHNLDSL